MTALVDDGISLVTFDVGGKPVKIGAKQIGQQVVCDRHEIVTAFDNGLIIRTSVIWNQVVPDKLTFALWTDFSDCYAFAANEMCSKIALLRGYGDHSEIGIWTYRSDVNQFVREEVIRCEGLCASKPDALCWLHDDRLEFRNFAGYLAHLTRRKRWFRNSYYWSF